MATVTIGRPYFEALLRRAELHASGHQLDTNPSLSNTVTVSKAEHEYLLQAVREYNILKNALFRGGLSMDTLETLLSGDTGTTEEDTSTFNYNSRGWGDHTITPQLGSVVTTTPTPRSSELSPDSDSTAVGEGLIRPRSHLHAYGRVPSSYHPESSMGMPEKEDISQTSSLRRVPTHDQRTLLISNLSDRSTHKDLVNVIRGGRILDIFIRNDRSATVSFVEGAAEFLAYAKRNDIYLHTKRLEVRWNDKQFHVPTHVANKITTGATRNIIVRGVAGKFAADEIRDHLDHIHNLIVVDITFKNGDAYISTNSIHNALFARTCMMSRTLYKGHRIDWYPDECAAPLPRPPVRVPQVAPVKKTMPTNLFAVLDLDTLDTDSEDENLSYMANGIRISNNWADATVA